ncbi:MAG: hypothetical protein AAF067_01065 [Pseudomonadota bacterium]
MIGVFDNKEKIHENAFQYCGSAEHEQHYADFNGSDLIPKKHSVPAQAPSSQSGAGIAPKARFFRYPLPK